MQPPSILPSRAVLWLLALVVAVVWFANLGSRSLYHPDEGRYAEIAREMAATGDWITPRLNGLKYFEKPPLQYWITATAYRAFGVHEWTARLWPALAGFLAIAAIGVAGNALGGATLGVFAALVLAGTLFHAGMSQLVTLDSGLAFFLTLALAGLLVAHQDDTTARETRTWMWVAWGAMALATLSKGLIGIALPGGALVIYTALTRDVALWRRLHIVSGAAIFLAIAAPWFVAVSLANREFAHFFFIHEHYERFLTEEHLRAGPWYYFIPILIAGALPWTGVLGSGIPRMWREGTPNSQGFSWQRFTLVFAAFVFLFFSASGSKLPSYILPMFAPLALITGATLVATPVSALRRLASVGAVIAILVAIAAIAGYDALITPTASESGQPGPVLLAFGAWLKAATLVVATGQLVAWRAFGAAERTPTARFVGVAALALSMLTGTAIAVAGFDAFSATRSTSAMLRSAQQTLNLAPDAPFFQVEMYDQTAQFYLRRTTTLVEIRDELALGIDAEPDRQIPTVAAWTSLWRTLDQGYAMMPPATYERLASESLPMRVVERDGRRVLVSRR